jgi:hypothetical protein
MGMSNFPNGFSNGVTIRGLPLQVAHPGKVFWVNNSTVLPPGGVAGANGNDGSYLKPVATLTRALALCKANRGDIIMLMPGHAENVATAAAIDVNVAGVAVIGLGTGTKRPKFSFTAAAATFAITAGNCSFYNVQWEANFADVAIGLDVSGVDGLSFDSCYFTEASTNLNYVHVVDLATGCDDISFEKCKWITGDAANDSHINAVASSGFYMKDCFLAANVAQTSVVGLVASSGNMTNVWIDNCAFRSNIDGALWVDFNGTANSGLITNCNVSSIDGAGAQNTLDFTGGHAFNCRFAGEADAWGLEGGGAAVYNNA